MSASASPAQKRNSDKEEVSGISQKAKVGDESLLEYDGLLSIYEKAQIAYFEAYTAYCDAYETNYELYYGAERNKQLTKVHEAMVVPLKKIEEDSKEQENFLEIFKRKLTFKKKHLSEKLPTAETFAHEQTKRRMEEALKTIEFAQKKQDGEKYRISSAHNSSYLEAFLRDMPIKPSGWKIHLSVTINKDNLKKAWNLFKVILLKNSLSYAKVANFLREARIETGEEITLYQSLDKIEWKPILIDIEVNFRENDIKASSSFASGDRCIQGSRYMSYRNDFYPDHKTTLRLEKIKPVIEKVVKALKAGGKEKAVVSSIDQDLTQFGIEKVGSKQEWGLRLVKHVKRELHKGYDPMQTVCYNPFDKEDDPNSEINLEALLSAKK